MNNQKSPTYPLHQAALIERMVKGEELSSNELRLIQHPVLRQIRDIALTGNDNKKAMLIDANDPAIDKFLDWLAVQARRSDGSLDDLLGLNPIRIADLLARDFPPLQWLVEGTIARGHLVMLAGRPKSGKSWLVLQLAQCLDMGSPFLEKATKPVKVLLIALEDGERRIYDRCNLLNWQADRAKVIFHIEPMDDRRGGLGCGVEQIRALADQYDLIILDTLIKTLTGQANENDNTQMGEIINNLAEIAHQSETAIVLVHHTGKGVSENIFDTLRGASALRGAYDVGMVLERKQDEIEAILHGESRDLDLRPITIRQAVNGAGWEFLGNSREITKIRAGRKTLEAMLELDPNNQGVTVEDIANFRVVHPATIREQLKRAEVEGFAYRQNQAVELELSPDGANRKKFAKPADLWFVADHFR